MKATGPRLLQIILIAAISFGWLPAQSRKCENILGVNILLVDNSRSVPSMDPSKSRADVIKELMESLAGFENRLVLFGGRNEVSVDQPDRFVNDGWHTDFYFAFEAAVRIRKEYPPDCEVKLILITDGILDAFIVDYPEEKFALKSEVMSHSRKMALKLLEESHVPLYIILLGDQYDKHFIESLSARANGAMRSNPLTESAARFLNNDGFIFKQFIFKLPEKSSMAEVKKGLQTVNYTEAPRFEYSLIGLLVLCLLAFVVVAVRSFPAPGDREVIDLVEGIPVLIGADVKDPAVIANSARSGLKLCLQPVTSTNAAVASLSYQRRHFDFSSRGLTGMDKLDPVTRRLLDSDVHSLAGRLDLLEKQGSDEEMIAATDLKYYCSNLELEQIKKILQAREMDRMDIQAKDFLHAKVYVSLAPDLLEELTEQRVFLTIPSRNIVRSQLLEDTNIDLNRFRLKVVKVQKDSKYSARVILEYLRVPATLGLKWVVPAFIQKAIRLRKAITANFNPTEH